jgi:predicted nucleic acid-binding protein
VALAVVDASAVAAILFAEPEAEALGERLRGEDLAAPSLLPFEVANVAAVKLRRGSTPRRALEVGLEAFSRLGVALYPTDPTALLSLASRTGLTAYDAAYLWLAGSLGAELVTLDRKLERAWRDER